nr:carboxypeptidase-like regulatory domain-containing protein [uncultured Carboxylicivirga sp.]
MQYFRLFLTLLLLSLTLNSFSQITGNIRDKDNNPIEYAHIMCIHSNVGCISNDKGDFNLTAHIGDTIQIYHLNYKLKELIVTDSNLHILMDNKTQMLPEVFVSGNYGFLLFSKCTTNTYSKLLISHLSRAYWNGLDIINNDTICRVDIDFDIAQKKLNKIGRETNTNCRKVSERKIAMDGYDTAEEYINFQVRVKPPENNFLIYKDFMNDYVCTIVETNDQYKILFYPKALVKKGYNNMEVVIHKHNMCLDYIASCTAQDKLQYTNVGKVAGKSINKQMIMVYLKYQYQEEHCFLSQFEMNKSMNYLFQDNEISRLQCSRYKVYNYNLSEESSREGKNMMEYSILKAASNNYNTEFWTNAPELNENMFSFEELSTSNNNYTIDNK